MRAAERATLDVEWRLGATATGARPRRARGWCSAASGSRYDKLLDRDRRRARARGRAPSRSTACSSLRGARRRARAARRASTGGPRLAVVGAGFIGCEVAATARKRGLDVTLIDVAPQPMTALGAGRRRALRRAAPRARRRPAARRRASTGSRATGGSRRSGSPTARASRPTSPSSRSARSPTPTGSPSSGLELQPGVVCDATLAARDADGVLRGRRRRRVAAPDGRRRRRSGSSTGRTPPSRAPPPARNLLAAPAERTPYEAVPYFWSDQYDVKIQSVGLPARAERTHRARGAPTATGSCSAASAAAGWSPRSASTRRGGCRSTAAGSRRCRCSRTSSRPCRADEKALAASTQGAGPHARRLGPARAARRVARRARHPVRPAPHLRRRADARPGRLRVRRVARLEPQPERHRRPGRRRRARAAARARSTRTSRCSASASAARRSPPRSARRSRPRRSPSSAGRRSRPTSPSWSRAGPWLEWHFDRFATPAGRDRDRPHRRGAAGVPPRPPPRRPVPPGEHGRDRRAAGPRADARAARARSASPTATR